MRERTTTTITATASTGEYDQAVHMAISETLNNILEVVLLAPSDSFTMIPRITFLKQLNTTVHLLKSVLPSGVTRQQTILKSVYLAKHACFCAERGASDWLCRPHVACPCPLATLVLAWLYCIPSLSDPLARLHRWWHGAHTHRGGIAF